MNSLRTLLACSLILASTFAADKEADAGKARLQRQLEQIIIPKLELREATIRDAIDFLKKKSVELDAHPPAGSRGVNIVLKLADPRTPAPGAAPQAAVQNPAEARITVSLSGISLLEALKYVTSLANLKFQVEPDGVAIVPLNSSTGPLITKEWKIPADLIPRTPPAGGATEIADRVTAKNWLVANGVAFDGAASVIYVIKSSRLIVRNTQDQLDLVDAIINQVRGGEPLSVEIGCQVVEISGKDLQELTFDTLLRQLKPDTENVFISGGGDVGHPAELDPPPVISGMDSAELKMSAPFIARLLFPHYSASSGVFTDPQFQLAMRMLQRKKGAGFLSAPKLTVKSGQSAVIELIREFRPPLVDTLPQVPRAAPTPASAKLSNSSSPPFSHENHNLSVTLEVEPVVGRDGYTIDLNFKSRATEFEGSAGYGSPITAKIINPATGVSTQNIVTPSVRLHEIFSARQETRSVCIYDGSTVMLGGVLSEDLPKGLKEDLLLRSVPMLGQPSASSGPDQPTRRHLILFVTARLVNASSSPVRAEKSPSSRSSHPPRGGRKN